MVEPRVKGNLNVKDTATGMVRTADPAVDRMNKPRFFGEAIEVGGGEKSSKALFMH
jgi:hypothetical protein